MAHNNTNDKIEGGTNFMRRESRGKKNTNKINTKKVFSVVGSILALAVIAFVITFIVYGNTLKKTTTELGSLNQNLTTTYDNSITEQTSNPYGKTINEVEKETSKSEENTSKTAKVAINTSSVEKETKNNTQTKTDTAKMQKTNQQATEKQEKVPDPTFKMPVLGEIVKEFANNKLVYSNTLDVWTAHNGIDIKADKTTVVKASAEGTVASIKNDPRYGLTIIIEHANGYKTVYANLLSTEFVVVGEKVKQGQSIGTVGNTASFEASDEPHLHFELLKENEQQDPELYLEMSH